MDRVADREDPTATTAKTASTESRGGQLPHTTKTFFNTKTAAAKKTKPDAEAVPAAGQKARHGKNQVQLGQAQGTRTRSN
jgi:hypothetical protein